MANLLLYPEDLSISTWSKNFCVINTDLINAPDGTLTADKITDDSGGGTTANVSVQQTEVSTGAYMTSGFAKKDQLDWILFETALRGSLDEFAYFDINNGIVGSTVGPDVVDLGIDNYGDGWFRWWVQMVSDPDGAWQWRVKPANSDGDRDIARDGTSSIYSWGHLLETGTVLNPYTSVAGIVVEPAAGRRQYLTVTRRLLNTPPTKRIYPKPTRGLFRD